MKRGRMIHFCGTTTANIAQAAVEPQQVVLEEGMHAYITATIKIMMVAIKVAIIFLLAAELFPFPSNKPDLHVQRSRLTSSRILNSTLSGSHSRTLNRQGVHSSPS